MLQVIKERSIPIEKVAVAVLEQMDPKLSGEPVNPQLLSWKGMAVLVISDSTKELWVDSKEWDLNGNKILRGKLPYLW